STNQGNGNSGLSQRPCDGKLSQRSIMFIGNRLDGIQKSIGTSDIFIRVIRAVGTTVAVRKLLTNFHFAGQNTALQGTVGQYSVSLYLGIGNDLFFNIPQQHTVWHLIGSK